MLNLKEKLVHFVLAPYFPKYGALQDREGYFFDQVAFVMGFSMVSGFTILLIEIILMWATSNSLFWGVSVTSTFIDMFVLILCLYALWFLGVSWYEVNVHMERMYASSAPSRHVHNQAVRLLPWEYPRESQTLYSESYHRDGWRMTFPN